MIVCNVLRVTRLQTQPTLWLCQTHECCHPNKIFCSILSEWKKLIITQETSLLLIDKQQWQVSEFVYTVAKENACGTKYVRIVDVKEYVETESHYLEKIGIGLWRCTDRCNHS